MKRRAFVLSSLLATLFVSGCTTIKRSPDNVGPNTEYLEQQLAVTNPSLKKLVVVDLLEDYRDGSQFIQANIRNVSDRSLFVTHRLEWFDAKGFLISKTDDQRVRIEPGDFEFIQAKQPSVEAVFFRVVVK